METGSLKVSSIPAASPGQIKSFTTSTWLLESALLGYGQCMSGLPLKAGLRCRGAGTSQCRSVSSSRKEEAGWTLERSVPRRVHKWIMPSPGNRATEAGERSKIVEGLLSIKPLSTSLVLLGGSGASGKESACQCRRCKKFRFHPWVQKIPWRRKWQPTWIFLPGKFYGQEEPGGLQSMEPQRGGHGWATKHRGAVSLLRGWTCVTVSFMFSDFLGNL